MFRPVISLILLLNLAILQAIAPLPLSLIALVKEYYSRRRRYYVREL
jgi:hypothetical protein